MIGKFDPKSHWEKVYQSKKPEEVSWYQLNPTISVELIAFAGISQEQRIIDVGGGASVLIDKLFEDRRKYIEAMKKAVKPDGYGIIATFALECPLKCSGLNVERYNAEKLSEEIGNHFMLLKNVEEAYITPWNSEQKFVYCLFRRIT